MLNSNALQQTIEKTTKALLDLQHPEGYWYFTLEANPAIDAGFIQLMYFLGSVDKEIEKGIMNRILQVQREDGSWGLYYSDSGDLNTTIECYFSLRLAGSSKDQAPLAKAKAFILSKGGLTQARVFTRIHLALFGLIPWEAAPSLPSSIILLPPWAPFNIYNFSSWARASIVPLLVVLNKRPQVSSNGVDLEELYLEPTNKRKWDFVKQTSPLSIEKLFMLIDKGLKYVEKVPYKPWRPLAMEKAIQWTWEHIQKTEDIYPALAYGAMAFKAFGYANDSIQIQTALNALKSFQQKYVGPELPACAFDGYKGSTIHQQCCISPVWDTPWALTALIEANPARKYDEKLLKAGKWLLSKKIKNPNGDWRFKNPEGEPGGWSFEFKNEFFPDTDDTIQVLNALNELSLPRSEKQEAMERGLQWLLSMQNDDGGWGAFDKNNDLELINKIPFSDHGACLDPSSPDITGRALELLLKLKWNTGKTSREAARGGGSNGFAVGGGDASPYDAKPIQKALQYLKCSQENFGGWFGRWGVNYIYGTWAVLTGLSYFEKENPLKKQTEKAIAWLHSIQNRDGGFSESPESYVTKQFKPYPKSVPSQTAWGVMALIAAGETKSNAVQRGIQFLLDHSQEGTWEEPYFTGTGFPGHFYIRYHGYRTYFPLLALARYQRATSPPVF